MGSVDLLKGPSQILPVESMAHVREHEMPQKDPHTAKAAGSGPTGLDQVIQDNHDT